METSEKLAVVAIILAGAAVALFFVPLPLYLPGEGRPEFNVSEFQVIGSSVSMYVENKGSGDAHNVKIEVHGHSEADWIHLNAFDTSGPSELKAGNKQIAISCDEGVTYELIVGFRS